MGSHNVPCVTGRVANVPGLQTVCTLCQTGNIGNEQHNANVHGVSDRDDGLYGDHAAAMVQSMWQHAYVIMQLRNVSKNVWTRTVNKALTARHQISPRWLKMM